MFRGFFAAIFLSFFLWLLMGCAICEATVSEDADGTPEKPFSLFKPGTTKFAKKGSAGVITDGKTYESFTSPSLGYVNDVLVVFAQARNGAADEKKTFDIVEGYFEIGENDKLIDKDTKASGGKIEWKKQVTTNAENECAGDPTFVVNNTDIYVLLKNSSCTDDSKMEYWIINGKFTDIENTKGIKWDTSIDLINKLKSGNQQPNQITSVASGGSGIVVNETFAVPVRYTQNGKQFISIITKKSKSNNEMWDFVLSKDITEEMYPAVAGWKEKVIMMTTNKKGLRNVYEATDMKATWTEVVGSFLTMLKATKESSSDEYGGRNSFITVELVINSNKEKVMLFTKPAKTKNGNCFLHLWMTDYQRVSLA